MADLIALSPGPFIEICPVCKCEADHSHFGSLIKSCNSCAAFFRRTIQSKKSYKCRANENCLLKKDKHQRGCQSCRFKKCLQIGMLADTVRSKPKVQLIEDDGSLSFLMKCRRSNFTNRAKATCNIYGGAGSFINMSNQLKTAFSCKQALRAENIVLKQFIQTLDLCLDPLMVQELVQNFMPMWIVSESLLSTVRHRGFRSKRSYYLDDSFLKYNEDFVVDYYRQYKGLYNPLLVAETGFELYTKIIQTSEKIYQSRIDEMEFTAIQFVLLLQIAIRLEPRSVEFRKKLNQLFMALQKHFQSNFENIALRMDEFMMNVERVQEVKRSQDQAFAMQYVNDSNGEMELQVTPFIR